MLYIIMTDSWRTVHCQWKFKSLTIAGNFTDDRLNKTSNDANLAIVNIWWPQWRHWLIEHRVELKPQVVESHLIAR